MSSITANRRQNVTNDYIIVIAQVRYIFESPSPISISPNEFQAFVFFISWRL